MRAASVGGRLDIGEDKLTLAAAHLAQHEDRGALDTIASDRPMAFQLDDVRASYLMTAGRWSIEPTRAGDQLDLSTAPRSWAFRPARPIATGWWCRAA